MAGSPVLFTLAVPWDILDGCKAIALDIGGSVIKITYIDKDDWMEPSKRLKGTKGRIRFASFSREHLQEAFKFMHSHVHMLPKSQDETIDIFTTGIGGSQLTLNITKELNVRNKNLSEFDCFVYSFVHLLKNHAKKEILLEPHKPAYEVAKKEYAQVIEIVENMKGLTAIDLHLDEETPEYVFEDSHRNADKLVVQDKSIFPCLLTMVGSGVGYMLVREDGTFDAIDGSNRGGRMFLGQGALMTGVKNYDDLMALCGKGESRGVSTTTVHLGEGIQDNKDDLYSGIKDFDEATIYSFGQTVGKKLGDFKKEDLACGLLQTMCLDIVQTTHLLAHVCEVKHVFFCGSFLQHHLVREELTLEWLRRDTGGSLGNPHTRGKQLYCHFMKHGSHLGSLGAFLNAKFHFLQSTPDPEEASDPPATTVKEEGQKKTANYKSSMGM